MAPTAGWYDDPRDPSRLRYWDGDEWTEHVEDRPAGGQAAPTVHYPGAPQSRERDWRYGTAQQPPPMAGPAEPAPSAGQQLPAAQPWAQGSASGPRTPDGSAITSWGKRFAAWLLDSIFVFFVSLPLSGYFLYRYTKTVVDDMNAGTMNGLLPSDQALRWELAFLAVVLVVEVCYQAVFLRIRGATPGKRALGISVRQWNEGGVLPWSTIARRLGFIYGLGLASQVPYVGVLASITLLVNYLWPLWDKRRQALHDKFADTGVIDGPRRHATG